jgi:FkbM family methyltransferase
MALTDSIAFASRKLARTRLNRFSEALRRYYPVKSGSTTIHDFDSDLRFYIDRASTVSAAIYWRGHCSTRVANFLTDHLRPNMTFVDVGANVGELTLLAAKRLANGRVLAFEPNPAIFSQLCRNLNLNKSLRVELFNLGLFDRDDFLPMYRMQDFQFGTINEGVPSLFSSGTDRQEETVQLRRFDDVARECGLQRLDVMKIDVEGAEMMVLRGAEEFINRFRPVIITEMSDANFRRASYTPNDLMSYFRSLEYDIQLLDHRGGKPPLQCDAICLPRSRANQ